MKPAPPAPEPAPRVEIDNERFEKTVFGGSRFPLDTAVQTSIGARTTVRQVMADAGANAILIDFWASWCGPCVQSMPALKSKSTALQSRGVVVAGMNVEGDPRAAERMRLRQGISFPWLVEPRGEPFTRQFGIDSIPRMLLIDRDGKVLFNGHPGDRKLDAALGRISGASSGDRGMFASL